MIHNSNILFTDEKSQEVSLSYIEINITIKDNRASYDGRKPKASIDVFMQ